VAGAEGEIDQQCIKSEEPEHRPRPHHEECDPGTETHDAGEPHQHREPARAERPVRPQDRGEPWTVYIRYCSHPSSRTAAASTYATGLRCASPPSLDTPRRRQGYPGIMDQAKIEEIFDRFAAQNPEPQGELEYVNPFTLLVAVVLSAQSTDVGVNKATRELFKVADT